MSYVGILRIDDATGEARPHAEVRNAMAGALWIWSTLDKAYGERFSLLSPACWRLANLGAMSDRDCLVCGWTFDGAWVARAHLPALADALEAFVAEHGASVEPTVAHVAAVLRELAADEGARGACFHQTSITSDPWRVRAAPDEAEHFDADRRFTFGRDVTDANGREPFEVWAEFGPEGLAQKRAAAAEGTG